MFVPTSDLFETLYHLFSKRVSFLENECILELKLMAGKENPRRGDFRCQHDFFVMLLRRNAISTELSIFAGCIVVGRSGFFLSIYCQEDYSFWSFLSCNIPRSVTVKEAESMSRFQDPWISPITLCL